MNNYKKPYFIEKYFITKTIMKKSKNLSNIFLTFKDKHIEREFLEQNDYDYRVFYRAGLIWSFIIWLMIAIVSFSLSFPDISTLYIITYTLVIPVQIAVFFITFIKRFVKHYQWLAALANLITAVSYLHIGFYYSHSTTFTIGGMILMILFAYFIFRLRFKMAILFTTPYMIACIILIITHKDSYLFAEFIINIFLITSTIIICNTGGYLFEINSRELFLFNRIAGKTEQRYRTRSGTCPI